MRLPRAWFLPETHDVLGTLTAQLAVVEAVVGVLRAWCAGTGGQDIVVQLRSLLASEHEVRRRLQTQVRSSFSTPLAAEDLFELGERLGAVAERAYGLAREAQLSRTAPDPRLGGQVEVIVAAMTPLGAAIRALPRGGAATLADEALEQLVRAEHAYREAIADLEAETDLRRELRRREQYRRSELLAEAIQHLARRTWYAVYKSQ
ncbi:hypothetical protein [Mycolicibacterium chlorophenolicum]|uniref:Uncharacterized protein n=1 Tax=Mycolicibacterium chlorophenolicum TaxID=37916 RepID=A0A0J6VXV6_9MYCO|nr:hypothetical protein [Mycolicibacterium chlorophenolicum]KMO74308.1 hypothetical protein MCHLDSM_03747 [Mycolicibacterium chlorophenolicum]